MAYVYWIHLPEHTDMFREGYIGITSKTVAKRFAAHKRSARMGSKLPVHRAIRKHRDELVIDVLWEFDLELCQLVEWGYRSKPNIGWNLAVGGESTRLGTKASPATVEKLKQIAKARIPQLKAQASLAMAGKRHTVAAKKLMSERHSGKHMSLEARAKMSMAKRGMSDTTKAKMSKAASEKAPWKNPRSNKCVWLKASEILEYRSKNPTHGHSRASTVFGFSKGQLATMYAKFCAGWIPSEDESWLEFYKINIKGSL